MDGQFSKLWAGLMLAGCVLFFLPGMAHHVFCGALKWFYLWLDRTEEAREVVVFFQRHLCRHIPLIFGFADLCAVSARGRGQRYHQLAPLSLSVQHAAPVFTAVLYMSGKMEKRRSVCRQPYILHLRRKK